MRLMCACAVPCDELADVYVVNSCTVTATSDKKTRQALRRFKRQNPSGVVALTGCFPQAFAQQAQEIPEADVITGAMPAFKALMEDYRG